MQLANVLLRSVVAACLALTTTWSGALGQVQAPAKDYEPQVGQGGKDVIWVPTPQALVDRMMEMAKVTPQDYVIDLGSGDGRTVITAAKLGAKAHGIEYNPDMVELSKRNAAEGRASATRPPSSTATSSRAISRRRRWSPCSCSPASISSCAPSCST